MVKETLPSNREEAGIGDGGEGVRSSAPFVELASRLFSKAEESRTIAFVAVHSNEGVSRTISKLLHELVRQGKRPVIVNADSDPCTRPDGVKCEPDELNGVTPRNLLKRTNVRRRGYLNNLTTCLNRY
jgi:hypothetical protein